VSACIWSSKNLKVLKDSAAILCTGWLEVIIREESHSAELVPVSVYGGRSKNLKDHKRSRPLRTTTSSAETNAALWGINPSIAPYSRTSLGSNSTPLTLTVKILRQAAPSLLGTSNAGSHV